MRSPETKLDDRAIEGVLLQQEGPRLIHIWDPVQDKVVRTGDFRILEEFDALHDEMPIQNMQTCPNRSSAIENRASETSQEMQISEDAVRPADGFTAAVIPPPSQQKAGHLPAPRS